MDKKGMSWTLAWFLSSISCFGLGVAYAAQAHNKISEDNQGYPGYQGAHYSVGLRMAEIQAGIDSTKRETLCHRIIYYMVPARTGLKARLQTKSHKTQ